MYFDTHAHIDDKKFDETRYSVIKSAMRGELSCLVNIGSDITSSENSVQLADNYDFIYAAVGIHPHDSQNVSYESFARLEQLADHPKVVAIGEIGFDYHYDFSDKASQSHAFNHQMELAKKLRLPVVIHNREAHKDTLDVLRHYPGVTGIVHSYSGSLETARILLDMGYYLSFNGIITFKNAHRTREVLQYLPHDRVLIETDCPYLSPEPYRGQLNTPNMIKYIAQAVAEIWGVPVEEVARITMENGKRIYQIS